MNRPKTGKHGGRDEPIEDPQLLGDSLRQLFETETEFSIKVEGTSTLPYSSRIQQVLPETGEIILKLVRPLPHELMGGAVFRMVFAVNDQRYEALTTYVQREAYLQYRFIQPENLFFADRRRFKRYPFRPRESAYVIASDGGIPGLGVAGPLVNVSMGGLCLRVDRVLKLEDGLRIPASTALFDRGSSFPRIRIQDLPRLPLLELPGRVSHASERGSEILLGMDFGELSEEQARSLSDCLAFREKMFQGRAGAVYSEGQSLVRPESSGRPGEEPSLPGQESRMQRGPAMDPLSLLERKTARLVLVGHSGALLERCQKGLWQYGYHRVEIAENCEQAQSLWQSPNRSKPKLVLLDLSLAQVGDQEPLAAVRHLERQMAGLGDVPKVILCGDLDPTMLLGQTPGTRFLLCGPDEAQWIEALDNLLEIGYEPL